MLFMPQKSRSRRTLTKKTKKNIKEIKKNRKKKKPWAATTICSKFTFFFSITARQGSNKDSNVFGKTCAGPGHFFLPHIHSHNGFTVPTYSHKHTNIHCCVLVFAKCTANSAEISLLERTVNESTLVSAYIILIKPKT